MKALFLILLAWPSLLTQAQTPIHKSIPVQPGQVASFHFDYPELIRVSTWDKNEISINGTVSINGGESDDAFELTSSVSGNTILVRNEIHNLKGLPQRVTITRGTQKIVFKSREDYRKYAETNGRDFHTMNCGVDMDISIEVKVPRNMETRIESVYGMVEIRGFSGPLIVEATYGGVDAAVAEQATGELVAETSYGQIYSNLDARLTGDGFRQGDFHTVVSAKPGSGPRYSFESKYGNVYLRKPAVN